jgi:hypothetical protein
MRHITLSLRTGIGPEANWDRPRALHGRLARLGNKQSPSPHNSFSLRQRQHTRNNQNFRSYERHNCRVSVEPRRTGAAGPGVGKQLVVVVVGNKRSMSVIAQEMRWLRCNFIDVVITSSGDLVEVEFLHVQAVLF